MNEVTYNPEIFEDAYDYIYSSCQTIPLDVAVMSLAANLMDALEALISEELAAGDGETLGVEIANTVQVQIMELMSSFGYTTSSTIN